MHGGAQQESAPTSLVTELGFGQLSYEILLAVDVHPATHIMYARSFAEDIWTELSPRLYVTIMTRGCIASSLKEHLKMHQP